MSNMYSIQVTSYKQELTHLILGGDANSLEGVSGRPSGLCHLKYVTACCADLVNDGTAESTF